MPRGLFILLLLCITKNSSGISPTKQYNQLCRQVQKVCKKTFTTSPTVAFKNWEHYCIKNKALVSMVPYNINYGIKIDSASSVLFNGQKIAIDNANFPLPYSANAQVSGNCIPDVMEQNNIWLLPLYDDEEQANDSLFPLQKVLYDRTIAAAQQGATGIIFYNNFQNKKTLFFNTLDTHQKVAIPAMLVAQKPIGKINQEEDKYNAMGYVYADMQVHIVPALYEGVFKTVFFNKQAKETWVFIVEENNLDAMVLSQSLTPYLLNNTTHNSLFVFANKEHSMLPVDTLLTAFSSLAINATHFCKLTSTASCFRKQAQRWVLIGNNANEERTLELNFCKELTAILENMQITY